METESKVFMYATAFTVVAGGVLMLSLVPAALGITKVQKAQRFSLIADGYRAASLAKTYDAKAAAIAMDTMMKEVIN